jgi:hypothetical protein
MSTKPQLSPIINGDFDWHCAFLCFDDMFK